MTKYFPSIESLFVRDPLTNRLRKGDIRDRTNLLIREWVVTEKVDGANFSFYIDEYEVKMRGRTENAQMPVDQLTELAASIPSHETILAHFGREKHENVTIKDNYEGPNTLCVYSRKYGSGVVFTNPTSQQIEETVASYSGQGDALIFDRNAKIIRDEEPAKPWSITFYGEAYGRGIEKGGKYRDDIGFICFDIQINQTWLADADVRDICKQLGIEVVPVVAYLKADNYHYHLTQLDRDSLTKIIPRSLVASTHGKKDVQPEGIVAKPTMTLFNNRYERVMWKLCYRDL